MSDVHTMITLAFKVYQEIKEYSNIHKIKTE